MNLESRQEYQRRCFCCAILNSRPVACRSRLFRYVLQHIRWKVLNRENSGITMSPTNRARFFDFAFPSKPWPFAWSTDDQEFFLSSDNSNFSCSILSTKHNMYWQRRGSFGRLCTDNQRNQRYDRAIVIGNVRRGFLILKFMFIFIFANLP